jgi:hypothetical protein
MVGETVVALSPIKAEPETRALCVISQTVRLLPLLGHKNGLVVRVV